MPYNGYNGPNDLGTVSPGIGNMCGVQATDCFIGLIQQTTVTLTAAQVDSMFTTPIVLVPAPGAGLSIMVDYATIKYVNNGTAFAGGGTISLQYQGGAAVTATAPAATITGATNTVIVPTTGIVTATQNAAITITNATAVFTGGGSGATQSTVTVNVSYIIV
jgi:hypothetical protein